MAKTIRKAAGFVVYRKSYNNVIEYLLMQASYENYHWTPPKGITHKVLFMIMCLYYKVRNQYLLQGIWKMMNLIWMQLFEKPRKKLVLK